MLVYALLYVCDSFIAHSFDAQMKKEKTNEKKKWKK